MDTVIKLIISIAIGSITIITETLDPGGSNKETLSTQGIEIEMINDFVKSEVIIDTTKEASSVIKTGNY